MKRKKTTTLASAAIGALAIISSVIMAESLSKGLSDQLAMYPVAALVLAIEAAVLLGVAVILIRYGGSVQQGVYSDQSGVIDALVGGNRFVAIQAAANVIAVLVQNIAAPYGPALAFIAVVTAVLFAPFSIKKLNNLSWELHR